MAGQGEDQFQPRLIIGNEIDLAWTRVSDCSGIARYEFQIATDGQFSGSSLVFSGNTSFPGVQRAFAIQAGREVRVMVQHDTIDDLESIHLARDVAKKIENSLQYPGQIKVTVIRETRAVDYAR